MFRWNIGRSTLAAGVVLAALFVSSLLLYSGCVSDTNAAGKMSQAEMIKRGEYLVTAGVCNDCHTPKLVNQEGLTLDKSRLLSGHPADELVSPPGDGFLSPTGWVAASNGHFTAWVGPWGISYAANLTPHPVTGIGSWTPESFVQAIRTGKHLGAGRPILPPMPWEAYREMTDQDLLAIFAYLKSIKPIDNQVPQPTPPVSAKS